MPERGGMTVLQELSKRVGATKDSSILELLAEDDSIGLQTRDVVDVGSIVFRPLSACSSSQELGCIRKLLELGKVGELFQNRRNALDRNDQKACKRLLKSKRIAQSLETHAAKIRGPLEVRKVVLFGIGESSEDRRTVFGVVLISRQQQVPYGYYFHLKAGLFACGLNQ